MANDAEFIEEFSDMERQLLKPFFSNVDKNIFVLTNLPEVIKGTLFSRYSRSDKSARRLLLDEFIPNKDVVEAIGHNMSSDVTASSLAINRAEDFYQRILVGYGDDSVAELAGVHIACENVSSLAGDILTDSRIGISPLEKSARYILFDKKVNGKYLWYRDSKIMNSEFADLYSQTMEMLFFSYAEWLPIVISHIKKVTPREEGTTDRAYESATRAKACDVLKNLLPAGRLTNVGLYGNGRSFEYMLTKLYSHNLQEANEIAKQIHEEMGKVIPAFVKRSQPSEYITSTRQNMSSFTTQIMGNAKALPSDSYIKLIDYERDGEIGILSAMLYVYSNYPIEQLREIVSKMSDEQKKQIVKNYLSSRRNRRDKPGRALENMYYTFEMCANYGIFRDLHRHRVMSQEKQLLTTDLGFDTPKELEDVGLTEKYKEIMIKTSQAAKKIAQKMPVEAQYLVPRAFRMRWYIKLNLREVYHLTELRSTKQGHIDYRRIAQKMRNFVAEKHPILVEYMQVDMNEYALPRIESEKRIDQKLAKLEEQTKKD